MNPVIIKIYPALQIIVSFALIGLILLQQRGVGLGGVFGGEGGFYRTKRGLEKLIFRLTIVCAVLFLLLTLLHFIF